MYTRWKRVQSNFWVSDTLCCHIGTCKPGSDNREQHCGERTEFPLWDLITEWSLCLLLFPKAVMLAGFGVTWPTLIIQNQRKLWMNLRRRTNKWPFLHSVKQKEVFIWERWETLVSRPIPGIRILRTNLQTALNICFPQIWSSGSCTLWQSDSTLLSYVPCYWEMQKRKPVGLLPPSSLCSDFFFLALLRLEAFVYIFSDVI